MSENYNGSRTATSVSYLSVREFLSLRLFPARFCAWHSAAVLGCETHHIPILVKAKLLKPLGNPPRNAPKYFSRDYILRLASDERWLTKMSEALVEHWANRNSKSEEVAG